MLGGYLDGGFIGLYDEERLAQLAHFTFFT
jgi:hypothetical protein